MPGYGGSNGPDGSRKSGDQGQGTRDANGGNTGGGRSVGKDPNPRNRGGSAAPGQSPSGGGVSINRVKKGVSVPGGYSTGPLQQENIPNGPTISKGGATDQNFSGLGFQDKFNRVKTHQQAVKDYVSRPVLGKVIDALAGPIYNERPPIFDNPHSWSGGTWHSSTNVPGVIGMLGGAVGGVPFGGLAGSIVGDITGIPEVWHGGSGPNSWGPASSGGLGLGGQPGASPDNNHDGKTGINSGLLGLGVTSPTPAQSQLNQSNVPQQAQQQPGLNFANIPSQYQPIGGPSPYGVNFPSWNYQYR